LAPKFSDWRPGDVVLVASDSSKVGALIEQVQRFFAGDPIAVPGVNWLEHRSGC